MSKHTPHPTKQTGRLHYHTKSYSDEFVCPVCGLARRFNLNYLGNRRVPMCDGKQIKAGDKLTFAEYQALKARAKAKAEGAE